MCGLTQFTETEQSERTAAIVVQHPQVIGLMQVIGDHVEMPGITLFGQIVWHLERK